MLWTPAHRSARPDAVALASRGRHVFAALRDGRITASRDGGQRWEPFAPTPAAGPTALAATARTLLLATCRGLFVHAGAWVPATGVPDGALVLTLAASGPRVVAGTLRHGVWRSLDGGHSWRPASTGLPLDGHGLEVHALARVRSQWLAAHAFGLHRSPDGGRSWTAAGAGLPLGAARADLVATGRAAFVGLDGRLFETADGQTWDEVGAGGEPVHLLGSAGGALLALRDDGTLVGSATGGATWQRAGDGLPGLPDALVGAGTDDRPTLVAALGPDGLWHRPALDAGPPAARAEITLEDAHPNPLSRYADLAFSLSAPAAVVLTVHDPLDREVARVTEGAFAAGRHRVRFVPGALPAGLYRWRLRADGRAQVRPLVVLGEGS